MRPCPEQGINVDVDGFNTCFGRHQEISRQGSSSSSWAATDGSVQTARLHTATHLLLAALKAVLDKDLSERQQHNP